MPSSRKHTHTFIRRRNTGDMLPLERGGQHVMVHGGELRPHNRLDLNEYNMKKIIINK